MELAKLIDYIPAISVLGAMIFILQTKCDKIFDKGNKTSNILILIGAFLFITIIIVHLFREQPWTADILKILIGILVGAGSVSIVNRNVGGNSIDISGNTNGDIAGRDINKNIQNIEKGISDIRDSVVHQNNQIKQFVSENNDYDYLVTIMHPIKIDEFHEEIENLINEYQNKGWTLKQIVPEYRRLDGILIFFTRKKQGEKTKLHLIKLEKNGQE
ncbi:hypothetical protein [Prevotella intermedia]|uniref:hypothetical protein n=1 Tax=Prevotella intermedia TaxID=28131 RepID=UPI0039783920